ncbi:hypothetical protein [Methylobacterium nodulans]|uniref:Uncharacterized protein n=1 Tax=Methylobacterium nodulans (strain LMG 21967 / CNCM I-2342 / ORS 2060) TaxID=460265 RepID=B8IA92_METNO|nr:hypothetical protein [Methylobacterium nodulans]ACL57579.1 hypothetical protein Mnod_2616 [Methylobacterium nodulans ORS 2060]ACL59155.1 hypothetical protein Mnod_4279 [Methylobacterium nodulans ORS 2060]
MAERRWHSRAELQARHLTGRVRGRPGWFGRVVMQVEVRSPEPLYPKVPPRGQRDVGAQGADTFWRDATVMDLAEINPRGRERDADRRARP